MSARLFRRTLLRSGLTTGLGDAAAERFTNSDEANRFLSRPYRTGYTLPDEV